MQYARARQLSQVVWTPGSRAKTAFYAAYVYFEKRCIKDSKKKVAKRQKMEEIWSGVNMEKGCQSSGSRLVVVCERAHTMPDWPSFVVRGGG